MAPEIDARFVAALKQVGITPESALAVVRDDALLSSTYLTGSLAAGLGNAGSDIDFHVFVDDERGSGAPMVAFEGEQLVDVQFFAADAPSSALASMPSELLPFGKAIVAVGALPPPQTLQRCSRWTRAIPVLADTPPVFDPAAVAIVSGALVRAALDRSLAAAYLADLVTAAGLPSRTAWALCGRALVELCNLLGGDLYEGHKWTWAKAQRGSAPADLVVRLAQVGSTSWPTLLTELGLPPVDPADVVVHRPRTAVELKLRHQSFFLVDSRRLVPFDAVRHTVDGDAAPADVIEMLRAGAVTVEVDGPALDARLRSAVAP